MEMLAIATPTMLVILSILGSVLGWGALEKWEKGPKERALRKALKAMEIEQIGKGETRKAKEHEMKREATKQWLAQQAAKERGAIKAQTVQRKADLLSGAPGTPGSVDAGLATARMASDPANAATILDLEF